MKLPQKIQAWTASRQGAALELHSFDFPKLHSDDVALRVIACGVCHSDLHLIHNDWEVSSYPLVPGHEILGEVIAVGDRVSRCKVGDKVGVGWQHSSCGHCSDCLNGDENFCENSQATCLGHLGGFADFHVAKETFCFVLPTALAKPEVAPLFCGGITVYSPLIEFLSKRDAKVAVVGLGGLGHFAVRFAQTMGYEVSVFSSSPDKKTEAQKLGAHHFLPSANEEEVLAQSNKFDLVLVTANVDLPYHAYIDTLRSDGTLCFVGLPPSPISFTIDKLLSKRRRIAASPVGSPKRIREMLEFSLLHGIQAQSEIFPVQEVNSVLTKVKANRVRYRAILEL